jgi:hypothetical protein
MEEWNNKLISENGLKGLNAKREYIFHMTKIFKTDWMIEY